MAQTKAKTKESTRILIIDDHPMMREGLAQVIEREPDLAVCGEAEDSRAAMEAVAKLQPDLALVDITLPGKNGLELIKDLQAVRPELMILVISMHDESLYAERVLRAGGRGYIMKQEGGKKIMRAIRTVLGGQIYVSETISSKILDLFSGRRPQAGTSPLERLTDRELEVYRLTGQGIGTREIAQRLHISGKTVEVHKANIKEKLGLRSSPELISHAARWCASQEPGVT